MHVSLAARLAWPEYWREVDGAAGAQRQYVYFCTSKASNFVLGSK